MKKTTLIASLFFVILFIQVSSSLTGTSSSYSVSMFGNGIVTGNPYSENYNSTFLSQSGGTTRNAESSSFRSNLGFFTESAYLRTVSIISYSVSPRSAVIGSTIGLSVSALNSQSVWAKITSPNSQEEILNLVNGQTVNYLPSPSVVGRYSVVFYANDSSGAIASVVDFFDLTEQIVSSSSGGSGGGGGGGSSTIIERCSYNWDCTPWSVCSDGLQTRVCANIGTCNGTESKPVESMQCSEALFDVALKLDSLDLTSNKALKFRVDLTEVMGSESIDVHVKYSIIDSKNYELFSQIETRAVKNSLYYEKILDGLNLKDGDYILRVDVLYGNLQRAFAEQQFNIVNGELQRSNAGITGFAASTEVILRRIAFSFSVLIVSLILLIWTYWHFARGPFKNTKGLLSYVTGLEVYTDKGIKIGKVYEVMVEDNKIYGLMVEVDKEAPINLPKVMIRYGSVQSIHDVVVVSSLISEEHLQKEVSA